MQERTSYEIPYPSSRQLTFDLGKIGLAKHHVRALLEVDVTEARRLIKQNRRSGTKISFTAWLIKVIADCVALHPPIAGVNDAKRSTVLVFNDVDISIVVEKEVNGSRVPLPYVIRKADKKSLSQIQEEIEAAKSQTVQGEGDYVLGDEYSTAGMKLFVRLPQWLRLMLMRLLVLNNPQRVKDMMGTVMITTAGMIGHTRGWIMPFGMHPLCLAFGSLNEQAAVYRGEIQKREILHLTVLIDHDVIDGVPAARFVDDLVKKLQTGFGLPA
ncbi:MAG TPA: 2-oxo acid dehydrogenase subunit E2 [Anaerolineales bacterium]|nr:2-oxo acid dehydrogenase subunit E2 [Anaerolineales bacterium]